MVIARAWVIAAALAGCSSGSAPSPSPVARGSAGSAHVGSSAAAVPPPAATIDVAAAIPAWQAVVERGAYLARRGEHGVVEGVVGPAVAAPAPATGSGSALPRSLAPTSAAVTATAAAPPPPPGLWLLDPTDATGTLAIRIHLDPLPHATTVHPGDHVAVAGAWQVDADHHWFWAATALASLPPLPDPAPAYVGHTIATAAPPDGAVPISRAHDRDVALFQLAGPPPALPGDGWPVGDRSAGPVVLLLDLPGERASYGAQDFRSPDERWHLERGATYWVRLGRIHHHGSEHPATVMARTAPVRAR